MANDRLENIKTELTQRLKAYNLADRISFDDSAFEALNIIGNGDLEYAVLYAGSAVLSALQNQKKSVTKEDIDGVDAIELVQLMTGGKNVWDDVKYIGTQVPTMFPEGIQARRAISRWDADRNRDTMDAVRNKRLPKYALTNLVQYAGTPRPTVEIPFKYRPSQDDARAVAESVASFVSEHTGEPNEVQDVSRRDDFGVQYFIRPKAMEGVDPLLVGPNYSVSKGFTSITGAQGVVVVSQEMFSKHDKTTLEAYVNSVKPKSDQDKTKSKD